MIAPEIPLQFYPGMYVHGRIAPSAITQWITCDGVISLKAAAPYNFTVVTPLFVSVSPQVRPKAHL